VAIVVWRLLPADDPELVPETTVTLPLAPVTSTEPSSTAASTAAPPTGAASVETTAGTARPPAQVRVVVLNGTAISGLAAGGVQRLAEAGYDVEPPGNYGQPVDTTRIWFTDGYALEAAALVAFFPAATVEPLPGGEDDRDADVVVVLGPDA